MYIYLRVRKVIFTSFFSPTHLLKYDFYVGYLNQKKKNLENKHQRI